MLTSPLFIILCWYFNTYKKYDSKMCFRIVAYAVSIMLLEQTSTICKKIALTEMHSARASRLGRFSVVKEFDLLFSRHPI